MEYLSDMYISEKINEVYVAYNQFMGIGRYRPVYKKVIPFEIERKRLFSFPPVVDIDPSQILSHLIIEYLFAGIYRAYIESFLSENGVRLMNMSNASKSIEKNIKKLDVEKNYYRQEEITDEIHTML